MSIEKINIGGADVEIADATARQNITTLQGEVNTIKGNIETNTTNISSNTDNITTLNNTLGSEPLQTTAQTVKGAINEVKQAVGEGGGGMTATYNASTNTLTIA